MFGYKLLKFMMKYETSSNVEEMCRAGKIRTIFDTS